MRLTFPCDDAQVIEAIGSDASGASLTWPDRGWHTSGEMMREMRAGAWRAPLISPYLLDLH